MSGPKYDSLADEPRTYIRSFIRIYLYKPVESSQVISRFFTFYQLHHKKKACFYYTKKAVEADVNVLRQRLGRI